MTPRNSHIDNPFLTYGYAGRKYFCDREQETATLCSALRNGRNVTLIAPRRIGKTGLILNTFDQLKDEGHDVVCVYIDIFSTRSLQELVTQLAKALLLSSQSKIETLMSRVGQMLKHCRPVVSMDPVTGTPSVTVNIEPGTEEATLHDIFEYTASSQRKFYIAIDEFQQIAQYSNPGTEALLRSYIQFTPNVHFIFAGSSQHIMSEMFVSVKRPFYQSTQIMQLDVIDEDKYHTWAQEFFVEKGGDLNRNTFHQLYQQFEGHTWYIQCILNRLHEHYDTVNDARQVTECIDMVLQEQTATYQTLLSLLPDKQLQLVKAIAAEGKVKSPTQGNFIAQYRLKAASSVNGALKSLVSKEIIYPASDGYMVYDRFLAMWLRQEMA